MTAPLVPLDLEQINSRLRMFTEVNADWVNSLGSSALPYLLRTDIPALIAEVKRLRAVPLVPQGWQPIETAPKDGTRVLLCWFDDIIAPIIHVGWNLGGGRRWQDTHHWLHNDGSWPTHWMPLHDPPVALDQEQDAP